MKPDYEFEPLGGSPRDGYNDPLKTMFGKKLQDNLAREAIQNSLDAVLDPNMPVTVKFNLEKWTKKEIPEVEKLSKIFQACSKDETSGAHFKNSEKTINSNNIPVLIISDFNTTGLTGANDNIKGKFYNFFKCVGGNNKQSGDAGSYGYGKAAYISGSCVDTFFATSYFTEKNVKQCLFMGSIRVVSHDVGGILKRGIGSFGLKNQIPIREIRKIPKQFLVRKEVSGTDIFVIGVRNPENWQDSVEKAVLKHFWLAILKNKLVVEVGDKKINKENLQAKIIESFKDLTLQAGWKTENPIPYLDAFLNGQKIESQLPTLGSVEFYLKIQKDPTLSTSHVACFRKNLMRIQVKRFQSLVPFSGVFLCPNEPGNSILRKMEPPNHMAWDKDEVHAKDEHDKTLPECAAADREYKSFIRTELDKLWASNPKATLKIENLDKFISLADADNEAELPINSTGEEKNNDETGGIVQKNLSVNLTIFKKEPKKTIDVPGTDTGDEVIVEGHGDQGILKPPTDVDVVNPEQNTGNEGNTGGGDTNAKVLNHTSRYMAYMDNGKPSHLIMVRSSAPNKSVVLKVQESGDEDLNPLQIVSVSPQGTIDKKGNISGLKTDKRGEIKIFLKLKKNIKPSIRTTLYAV